jgi:hypothetical protein
VLAVFPTCVYIDLGGHERVLAVLASDALALPIGIRLALPSTRIRWGIRPGDHLVVGEGCVRLPRADVVATRVLRPARVRPAPRRPGRAVTLPDPGVLGELAHDLAAAALAGERVETAVRGLVGVGAGLTPSGDDALCGVLLTLAAVDAPQSRSALAAVRTAVTAMLLRTTSLSAALLVAAGEGYAVPDVVRLVALLAGAGSTDRHCGTELSSRPAGPLPDLVDRVLSIGHTSGRDLLSGVGGALRALDELDAPGTREPLEPARREGAHHG